MGQSCTLGFIFRIQGVKAKPFCASTQARGGGTLYNDLYDEALPEGTFFTPPFSHVLFHKSSKTSLFDITILE